LSYKVHHAFCLLFLKLSLLHQRLLSFSQATKKDPTFCCIIFMICTQVDSVRETRSGAMFDTKCKFDIKDKGANLFSVPPAKSGFEYFLNVSSNILLSSCLLPLSSILLLRCLVRLEVASLTSTALSHTPQLIPKLA
jgi:hypothetical protein